jgi:hypothetical protein
VYLAGGVDRRVGLAFSTHPTIYRSLAFVPIVLGLDVGRPSSQWNSKLWALCLLALMGSSFAKIIRRHLLKLRLYLFGKPI